MKIVAIALSGLMLAGCMTTSGKPNLGAPPAKLVQKCAKTLPKLPNKDLTQAENERMHNRDNAIYRDCAGRHSGLVDFVKDRDARLSGNPDPWGGVR